MKHGLNTERTVRQAKRETKSLLIRVSSVFDPWLPYCLLRNSRHYHIARRTASSALERAESSGPSMKGPGRFLVPAAAELLGQAGAVEHRSDCGN